MLQIEQAVNSSTLRDVLKTHPVHDLEPVGSEYVFGRVHRDRAHYKGYWQEVRKLAKKTLLQLQGKDTPTRKFLILARPRSGSTLMADLLQQVPDLQCDREVFHFSVSHPTRYLRHLWQSHSTTAYGCKLLSYQMFEIQCLEDPLRFMEEIAEQGFKFIHLRRNTFDQSLSLARALETKIYHSLVRSIEHRGPDTSDGIYLDVARFEGLYRWNAAMLDYEDTLMSEFSHLRIQYETDLIAPEVQQKTIDRVCELIDHPTSPVSARLKPRRDDKGGKIENRVALEEAAAKIEAAG